MAVLKNKSRDYFLSLANILHNIKKMVLKNEQAGSEPRLKLEKRRKVF